MLALYRVPEPVDRAEVAPIPADIHEEIWRITLNNLPCFWITEETSQLQIDIFTPVILTPSTAKHITPSYGLQDFQHPHDTLLIIGPDSADLNYHHIPWELKTAPLTVGIPNFTQHSMWGFNAYAVFWWDRWTKEQNAA